MGYFKRKLRRSTAAEAAAGFERAAVGCPMAASPPTVGYIRLATDEGGIFHAAYALRRLIDLSDSERRGLAKLLAWFEAGLKPHAPSEAAAVFWFKADAREHTRRIWALVRFLQRHGRDVRMWTSRRPGRIVFEDAFQVAAVAHRDGRKRANQLPTSFRGG